MASLTSLFDPDLLRRYDTPGPRYTSYPTAPQFTSDFGEDGLREMAAISNGDPIPRPLSLYVHIPFCTSPCFYCGCNRIITRDTARGAAYLTRLYREAAMVSTLFDRDRDVEQVHFGGGTPTFSPPDELRRLGALIHKHFKLAPDCEFSIEVDPRRLSEDHVKALKEIGGNRASLGVQDTNAQVQLAVHRIQPHDLNIQVFGWLRDYGFRSLNVDLIFGLPLQTPESFSRTIDDVLGLNPDRLSVFSYAHVPWIKPAQKIFDDRANLPDAETKLAMFALAHRKLTAAGYVDIGLDHFARPDDELAIAQREETLHRNFQGYSTRAGASLYGFGMSSISQTVDTFRQNIKDLAEWRAALAKGELPTERGYRLTEEDQRRRVLVMSIMCHRKLDYAALSKQLGVDVPKTYAKEIASLADLEADGILKCTSTGVQVTPIGGPLLRVIAMRFDAYLSKAPNRHSKTI